MSDKTTAALAAEQADVEATTTQEPELLPAATLDELEQVDLGTVAEGERAPFRITDDRCADWAIRKIADERSEYDRLKALADEQIAAINEKVAAARKRMENGTSYLTSCLADFFATVPPQGDQNDGEVPPPLRHADLQEGHHQDQARRDQAGAVAQGQRLRRARKGRGVNPLG